MCVYCQNVNLKLQKLNIPGVSLEYQLYNKLICAKEPGKPYRNKKCIDRICLKCKNWGTTLKSFLVNELDTSKKIFWFTWEKTKVTGKNGQQSLRRNLVKKEGTIEECYNKLLEDDLLHPGQNFTFVQHYFTQTYQSRMYKNCKESLKLGECLVVQDFSRNRDIVH